MLKIPTEVNNPLLLHGDCVDLLRSIPSNIIDLVLTSPPYGTMRKSYEALLYAKFKNVAHELARVLKPGGFIVWVVGDQIETNNSRRLSCMPFKQAIYFNEDCKNLCLHDVMFWRKKNPLPRTSDRYKDDTEYMLIIRKGYKTNKFNPKQKETKRGGQMPTGTTRGNSKDDKLTQSWQVKKQKPYNYSTPLGRVWECAVGAGGTTNYQDGHAQHPAMFPEILASHHINTWTYPGAVVLDPFMGLGTTGVVAIANDRKFIGMDIQEEFVQRTKTRLRRQLATRNMGVESNIELHEELEGGYGFFPPHQR